MADLEQRELRLGFASDSEDSDDDMMDIGSDSSSDSSSSSSELSDASDPDLTTPAEMYVHHMANLYSECYMAKHTNILKSQGLMHLLLNNYKFNYPQISKTIWASTLLALMHW